MAANLEKALDSLRADVHALREDLQSLAEALKDSAQGKDDLAGEGVEDPCRKGAEHLEDAVESVRECGRKVADQVAEAMAKTPVRTLLAAVGAGAILASVLSWRHSR